MTMKIPENKKFVPAPEGIENVRKGYYAYNTHPDVSYPIINTKYDNKEICELTEVTLAKSLNGFFIRTNNSFAKMWKIGYFPSNESNKKIKF